MSGIEDAGASKTQVRYSSYRSPAENRVGRHKDWVVTSKVNPDEGGQGPWRKQQGTVWEAGKREAWLMAWPRSSFGREVAIEDL